MSRHKLEQPHHSPLHISRNPNANTSQEKQGKQVELYKIQTSSEPFHKWKLQTIYIASDSVRPSAFPHHWTFSSKLKINANRKQKQGNASDNKRSNFVHIYFGVKYKWMLFVTSYALPYMIWNITQKSNKQIVIYK